MKQHFLNTFILQTEKERLILYSQLKPNLTFNSLIFSCKSPFDSFSFCASLRNWVTIRTASLRIAALSVLGGLPGSKIEPNSKNLKIIPNLMWELKDREHWMREEKERYHASHSAYPSAIFPGKLWCQLHHMIHASTCKSNCTSWNI